MKMDQLDQQQQQVHHHIKQQIQNPTSFNLIRAQKRDPSFNSYLNDGTKPNQDSISTRSITEDVDQISIFDAAKYFSDLNDHNDHASPMQNVTSKVIDVTTIGRLSSVSSSIDGMSSNHHGRSFHATPTGSSEASWSSRTGLLQNPSGALGGVVKVFSPSPTLTDGRVRSSCKKSTKWGKIMNPKWLVLPKKCPCSGKKAVQVDERSVQVKPKSPRMVDLRMSPGIGTRQNGPSSKRSLSCNITTNGCSSRSSNDSNHNNKMVDSLKLVVDDHGNDMSVTNGVTTHGFTFPVLEDEPVVVKKMFKGISPDDLQQSDSARDSLEVFRMSPGLRRASYEEDNGSDGSSDLFEIESLSTTTYQCRDSIDGNENGVVSNRKKLGLNEEINMVDVVGSNEGYAPSEVSVDWSVATAEGVDRASLNNFLVSGSGTGHAAMMKAAEKNGGGGGKGEGKSVGGLLMSCRCEKAVNVDGPGPVKVARHVGGRPREEGKLGTLVQVGNNGNGKVGFDVGRQRSSLVTMPLAT